MKNHTNGLQNKKYNLWLKGIIALSLSIPLQSKMCGGKSGDSLANSIKVSKDFPGLLGNIVDISRKENGINYLHASIITGDEKKVSDVLARIDGDYKAQFKYSDETFPNSVDQDGNTALHVAIKHGKPKIVEQLIENLHINISIKNSKSEATPLHMAISNGWADIAIKLINKLYELQGKNTNTSQEMLPYNAELAKKQFASYPLSSQDKEENTPLHLAISKNLATVVDLLVTKLPIEALSLQNKKNQTPLYLAIQAKLNEKTRNLLIGKLPIGAFTSQDAKGRNVFHLAARDNDKNLFKALFDRIANLDTTKVHSILFTKDQEQRTVFSRTYLPAHKNVPNIGFNASDFKMFEDILTTTKDCLSKEELTTIYNEIEQHSSRLKPEYKLKLQGIVSQGIVSQGIVGQGIGNTNNASTLPQASIKI